MPHQARDPEPAETTDSTRSLCVRVAAGDESAFGDFYEQWRPFVEGRLRKSVRTGEIEDTLQEVFMRVITGLPKLETESAIGAWLATVSQRCAVDTLRRRQRFERSTREPRPQRTAATEASTSDDLTRAHTLLREAEGDLRSMIEARIRFGWTLDRIARAFGITPSAVDGRIGRQMNRFRKSIESEKTP